MQSPKYESYFVINKRREYEKTTLTGHSLQLPYKSARDNLQSGKRLSVTSRCHRILWEKDKQNLVLGGVKTYLTGRKIAEQPLHPNRNISTRNTYLNRSQNGPASARDSHLIDRSVIYQNQDSKVRKQLLKGFNQMAKSLYSKQQVESHTQVQIKPVTQQVATIDLSKEPLSMEERASYNYPLSYRYDYEGRKQKNGEKVTESIIHKQNQLLENSLKVDSLLENSLHDISSILTEKIMDQSINIHNVKSDSPAEPSIQNQKNPTLPMDSSMTSNRSSRKSRILQFKQQFNNTLEQQEIIQTEVISSRTVKDQESSLKSFTKDELCSSFYQPEEQHLPHRLLVVNSNRKNQLLASHKKEVRPVVLGENSKVNLVPTNNHFAMTVREHSPKASSKDDALESRSMKEKPLQREIHENRSEVNSGELHQHKTEAFNFSNILISQSQHIKPSKPRRSEQMVPVSDIGQKQQKLALQLKQKNQIQSVQINNRNQQQIKINLLFQRVLDLNPKPCESFILQTNEEVTESNNMQSILQNFYEQQLKRRSEANQILKSLINMKMIHERMETHLIN